MKFLRGPALALMVVLLVVMVACNGSRPNTSRTPTPTATSTAKSSASPSKTSTAKPSATPTPTKDSSNGLASPELAARHLHDAWQDNDRQRALMYASSPGVEKLFGTPYFQVDFTGCDAEDESFACFYSTGDEGIKMQVQGSAEAGFRVSEVTFINNP